MGIPYGSPEHVSHLIGAIYDCALDPDLWHSGIDKIRSELGFCYAVLGVYPLPEGEVLLMASTGIDAVRLNELAAHGEDIVELWGGDVRIMQFPLEEPIVQSHVVPAAALAASRYYMGWARPQGVRDAVAIGLERNPRMISTLSFGWHDDAGQLGSREIDILRLLSPHLRRAIAICQLLEMKSITAANSSAVIDALPTAVIIVDELMHILQANAAADELLSGSRLFRIRDGRLIVPSQMAAVEVAVAQAGEDETVLGRRGGTGLGVRGADGVPRVVHVLPLRRRAAGNRLFRRATAALFITDGERGIELPRDAFAALYGLTPAEARITELMGNGATQKRAAQTLGLRPSTVKTHLLSIFDKTGVRRQVDLVRLAAALAGPIAC